MATTTVLVLISSLLLLDGTRGEMCQTSVYGELGRDVELVCNLTAFRNVYWYDTIGRNSIPIATMEDTIKGGKGIARGKYDLTDGGNLVIKKSTVADEGLYHLMVLGVNSRAETSDIYIVLYANLGEATPRVDICGDKKMCLLSNSKSKSVQCSVQNVRPMASLSWFSECPRRMLNNIKQINISRGDLFSTYSTANLIQATPNHFQIFVCKSVIQLTSSHSSDAIVILENDIPIRSKFESQTKFYHHNEMVQLECSENSAKYAVWKRRSAFNTYDTIAYVVTGRLEFLQKGYDLTTGGDLIIINFAVHNEGDYVCIHVEEEEEVYRFHRIKAMKLPYNPFPNIVGCFGEENCTFATSEKAGHLTCHLAGVRPLAHLEWSVGSENDLLSSSAVELKSYVASHKDDAGFYDLYHTVYYTILSAEPTELYFSCSVTYPNQGYYQTQARMIFTTEAEPSSNTTGQPNTDGFTGNYRLHMTIAVCITVILVILMVLVTFTCARTWHRLGKSGQTLLGIFSRLFSPMLQPPPSENRQSLIEPVHGYEWDNGLGM